MELGASIGHVGSEEGHLLHMRAVRQRQRHHGYRLVSFRLVAEDHRAFWLGAGVPRQVDAFDGAKQDRVGQVYLVGRCRNHEGARLGGDPRLVDPDPLDADILEGDRHQLGVSWENLFHRTRTDDREAL